MSMSVDVLYDELIAHARIEQTMTYIGNKIAELTGITEAEGFKRVANYNWK